MPVYSGIRNGNSGAVGSGARVPTLISNTDFVDIAALESFASSNAVLLLNNANSFSTAFIAGDLYYYEGVEGVYVTGQWAVSGLTERRVSELISSYGIWELEASFTSFDLQNAVEDVISPIDFGTSKTSPNGLVSYEDTTKDFNILKSGAYLVKTRSRLARVGANAGVSEIFLQAQVSTDGGVNWVNNGNSVDVKLQDTDEVEIFFDFSAIFFPLGIRLRQTFARSSLGSNFGSVIAGVPSVPLQNLGLEPSPSAQVSVYRLRDFNYT